MTKRSLTLPFAPTRATTTTSLDEARDRLGGRAESGPRGGEVVLVDGGAGVVVHHDPDAAWVWVSEGRVKRATLASLVPSTLAASPELARVAGDVRVFAALREGERVRWVAADAAMQEGKLVEKCRFGALVATDAGAIVAVAFRRLWPLAHAEG